MVIKPQQPRGVGRDRFEQIYRQRPAKRLEDGDHLMFQHALRCLCQMCGRLMEFECPEDIAYLETECCGLRYRLKPRTVHVEIEDISSRPMLPKIEGSDYSDPDFNLKLMVKGKDPSVETVVSARKMSDAQRNLGKPMPPPSNRAPEPQVIVYRAKGNEDAPISSAAHAADEISVPILPLPSKPPQVPRPPVIRSEASQQPASEAPPKAKKKRRVRRCGVCREPGHDRRKCPQAGIPRTQ